MSTTEIIQVNPVEYGIAENKATELIGNLPQIKGERNLLEQVYEEVILLDIEDKETSKKAKELRLKIKDNRTKGIEVWHKTTKEFFLKGGQFVDAIKRKEVAVNERMEENLEGIEKYAENLEKERKAKLNAERVELLEPFDAFVPLGLNFGEISDEEFAKIFNGAKLQFEQQQKEEEEAEAEKQRQAEILKLHNERKEKVLPIWQFLPEGFKALNMGLATDMEFRSVLDEANKSKRKFDAEQVKIKAENERLAKEKADLEAKAKKDKEESEAKALKAKQEADTILKAEQDAKSKLEAELQAKKDADAKAEKERLAEEKRKQDEAKALAKAPIKKQLTVWVDDFKIAELNLENEKKTLIILKFEAFKKWAKSEIESL